jgi:hypothetical protein
VGKNIFVALLTLLISATSFGQFGSKEISLFDKEGEAKAYIAGDLTIYLWDGTPVAYLNNSNDTWHVYGFNGNHLGWYINGIIYNNEGDTVGAQQDAINMITSIEIGKGIKSMTPFKSIKEMAPIMRPILSRSWSRTPLIIFLRAGED